MTKAQVLTAAQTHGPVLVLDEPLSFWGAFEPRTGVILDVHHPQRGASVKGTILLMRESKGSGSAPGAIAEAIRLGTAPAAIITTGIDSFFALASVVAGVMYGQEVPVIALDAADFARLRTGQQIEISASGSILVELREATP